MSFHRAKLRRFVHAAAIAAMIVPAPALAAGGPGPMRFNTAEEAAKALIVAAESFDVDALRAILGPHGVDLVITEDRVQDRKQSEAFASAAHAKWSVARDPADDNVATVIVGTDDWPMPIPLVRSEGRWSFDTKSGREEILLRRIGRNELDAIEVARGYVEAQEEYSLTKHDGALVNQYAQRILSTPGKHDGLAWRNPDGTWGGPVGEGIVRVMQEGYTDRFGPYHGYYFKVLKGQGVAAPMGAMDYVVKGMMIGGFALAAAPADYGVTGVKSFLVSHDGIVYEKDLGPNTLQRFREMKLYNPDAGWLPVLETEP